MAGSCTTTKKVWHEVGKTWFIVVEFSWKSDTDGDVSGVGSISNISGRVEQVTFIPASGDVTPSADYDVQILDEWGRDVHILSQYLTFLTYLSIKHYCFV